MLLSMENNKKRLMVGYMILGSAGGMLGLALMKALHSNTQVTLQVAYCYVLLGLLVSAIGLFILKPFFKRSV